MESKRITGRIVPFRIVSPTAAGLFRSWQIADQAFAKLNHVVATQKLAAHLVHAYTHPFELAFADLKMYCSTRNQQDKTAREMAVAEGVS